MCIEARVWCRGSKKSGCGCKGGIVGPTNKKSQQGKQAGLEPTPTKLSGLFEHSFILIDVTSAAVVEQCFDKAGAWDGQVRGVMSVQPYSGAY